MNRPKSDWSFEYDDAAPPIPEKLKLNQFDPSKLPGGAYFIWIDPQIARERDAKAQILFAGILRIYHHDPEKYSDRQRLDSRSYDEKEYSRHDCDRTSSKHKTTSDSRHHCTCQHHCKCHHHCKCQPKCACTHDYPDDHDLKLSEGKKSWRQYRISGSGDLYSCSREALYSIIEELRTTRQPKALKQEERIDLVQFDRSEHRYYLRLANLSTNSTIVIETHAWRDTDNDWAKRQALSTVLEDHAIHTAPIKNRLANCLMGIRANSADHTLKVDNSSDEFIGQLGIVQISKEITRHARIETHFVGIDKPKIEEEKKDTFQNVWHKKMWRNLKQAYWQVSFNDIEEHPKEGVPGELIPADGLWTKFQLSRFHERFIEQSIRPPGLGATTKWTYSLLIVNQIAFGDNNPWGLMFDVGDSQGYDPPRQGAAIAAGQPFEAGGTLKDYTELYNWTAIHEFGHMQGLYHNPSDIGIMQPHRDQGPDEKPEGKPVNKHSERDRYLLMHLPDLWVKPGGVPFAYRYRATPIEILELVPENEGLLMSMEPIATQSGEAPEQITLRLRNHLGRDLLCPNERNSRPGFGCLGVRWYTPTGKWIELSPLRFPRDLNGLSGTSLLRSEEIEYRIPWNDQWPKPYQAGLYTLHAHLIWSLTHTAREGHSRTTSYRVSASGNLRVSSC